MKINSSSLNIILIFFLAMVCSSANSENKSTTYNALLLPVIHAEFRPFSHEHSADFEDVEIEGMLTALLSANRKKWNYVSELVASTEEFTVARLFARYQLTSNTDLLIGKLSSPLGYWNSTYHHGAHLQTSVHRPVVVEYEHEGGYLPNHVPGFKIENRSEFRTSQIISSLLLGLAPTFKEQLEPFSIEDTPTSDNLHTSFRVAIKPNELSRTEFGVFASKSDIESKSAAENITQLVAGAYMHKYLQDFDITTSWFHIENQIGSLPKTSFISGYVHVEYELVHELMTYGRIEKSLKNDHDPYLELFDSHASERTLFGLRYDYSRNQAVALELTKKDSEIDKHTHISLQWSAMYP